MSVNTVFADTGAVSVLSTVNKTTPLVEGADQQLTNADVEQTAKVSTTPADILNKVSGEVPLTMEQQQGEPNEQSVLQSMQRLADSSNQLAGMQTRGLEFSTAQESGRTVVKVIDKENGELIRQIPSEEFMQMADKISDLSEQINVAQGLLFESKV